MSRWLIATQTVLTLLIAGCAPARESGRVHLRIHNASTQVFEHVWQGLPTRGTDHDFGPIVPGATSAWHAFPVQLPHYRKTRIQLAGGRQLIDVIEPARWFGRPELAAGRYTLRYRLDDGRLQLELIHEVDE